MMPNDFPNVFFYKGKGRTALTKTTPSAALALTSLVAARLAVTSCCSSLSPSGAVQVCTASRPLKVRKPDKCSQSDSLALLPSQAGTAHCLFVFNPKSLFPLFNF